VKRSPETRERMRRAALARWQRAGERERVSQSNRDTCGDPLYRAIKRRLAEEQERRNRGHFGPRCVEPKKPIMPNLYAASW